MSPLPGASYHIHEMPLHVSCFFQMGGGGDNRARKSRVNLA